MGLVDERMAKAAAEKLQENLKMKLNEWMKQEFGKVEVELKQMIKYINQLEERIDKMEKMHSIDGFSHWMGAKSKK